jgi:hypothetical protein
MTIKEKEEFRKLFTWTNGNPRVPRFETLEDFIDQLLEKQREELIEEIENMWSDTSESIVMDMKRFYLNLRDLKPVRPQQPVEEGQ